MIFETYDFHDAILGYLKSQLHIPIDISLTIVQVEHLSDTVSIVDTDDRGTFLCESFKRENGAVIMRVTPVIYK